jgi:hypothetical protein
MNSHYFLKKIKNVRREGTGILPSVFASLPPSSDFGATGRRDPAVAGQAGQLDWPATLCEWAGDATLTIKEQRYTKKDQSNFLERCRPEEPKGRETEPFHRLFAWLNNGCSSGMLFGL